MPRNIASDVTDLDLAGNNISCVLEDDFVNTTNLRVLVLSNSRIKTLQRHCFHKLLQLERLDLTGNNIASLPSGVFVGLQSLRVLTMSGLPLTSYPTEFVAHTTELRVLSLSAIGDATIPAEYAHLPRLEVLDFFKDTVELKKITAAMFDNIRDSNITTLAIRNINNIEDIEKGAFSNLPAVRSLILACNSHLHFRPTVATLASTTNTSINTVVLDGADGENQMMYAEADFCSPFWLRVQRLSVKSTNIVTVVFNHAGCLSQVRELSIEYNSLIRLVPPAPNISAIFPRLRIISVSHRAFHTDGFTAAYCHQGMYLFHADHYFPAAPPIPLTRRWAVINETDKCGKDLIRLDGMPSSLDVIHMEDFGFSSPLMVNPIRLCISNTHVRYVNAARNKFTKVLDTGVQLFGINRLEILDISYGAIEMISPEIFHCFTNLRFLNLSHNALGISGSDLCKTFSSLRMLEVVDLSNNKLSGISPEAFDNCPRLRRLNLADNELTEIDINLRHLLELERIDLSGNRLVSLSDVFMTKLDRRCHVRSIEVNMQREMFMCNCESVSFVRWTRVTHVRLTEKDQLTCSYGDRDNVRMTEIDVDQLEAGCHVSILPIVVPIIAVVIIISVVTLFLRYHRWYIKYHLVLCWLRDGRTSSNTLGKQHDAMVTYFLHAANSRDQQGGVARISRWVCTRLLLRAEDEWGLRLYIGDRDDVGGASKMHNFVRGFESSDKLVVCLTQEFIDDTDCMNYLATALDSSKPLSKYIFVLFDDVQPASVPRRLRQLLLPNAPSVLLTWGDIEVEDEHAHQRFWRHMRDELMRDPDQERCRRRFDVLPLLTTNYDTHSDEI